MYLLKENLKTSLAFFSLHTALLSLSVYLTFRPPVCCPTPHPATFHESSQTQASPSRTFWACADASCAQFLVIRRFLGDVFVCVWHEARHIRARFLIILGYSFLFIALSLYLHWIDNWRFINLNSHRSTIVYSAITFFNELIMFELPTWR